MRLGLFSGCGLAVFVGPAMGALTAAFGLDILVPQALKHLMYELLFALLELLGQRQSDQLCVQ